MVADKLGDNNMILINFVLSPRPTFSVVIKRNGVKRLIWDDATGRVYLSHNSSAMACTVQADSVLYPDSKLQP